MNEPQTERKNEDKLCGGVPLMLRGGVPLKDVSATEHATILLKLDAIAKSIAEGSVQRVLAGAVHFALKHPDYKMSEADKQYLSTKIVEAFASSLAMFGVDVQGDSKKD